MRRKKDSPTDPLFMELFLEAIRKLGERFDSDPWLDAIDISLPGSWGEGYKLELYPDDLFKTIVDVYAKAFPNTQLFTQVSRPELIEYARKYTNVGWRGDGLGNPPHTEEFYPPWIEKISEQWKVAPVSFESYWWLCEWMRKGWDIDRVIEKTLEWHISSFNPKSMPIPTEWSEKCKYWISRMGYHYTIKAVTYPEAADAGTMVQIRVDLENTGSAPCYKKLPVVLRIVGNEMIYDFEQSCDITRWLPGAYTENLSMKLPCDIEGGEYDVEFGILSPHADAVYLATNAERDGAFYKIGTIKII